ncbi:MAG TPA: biotin/lipoyl-binding protein, partial [Vicinamibacterales bacterium]|nr:biotin/lipoyl-binding protein [Vicinamibacterales bacterium]
MTARKHVLLAGGMAAVLAAALSACSNRTATIPAGTLNPIAVTAATVAMADVADTFDVGGVVQARTTAAVTARIMAPVREVRVAPGDRVRAGQVLIVLDGRDLAARARSANADVRAADQAVTAASSEQQAAAATLALARASYDRIAGL